MLFSLLQALAALTATHAFASVPDVLAECGTGMVDGCRALAAHYAPVISQEHGSAPAYDIPTRFDFDGDEIATNNWDNASRFAQVPAIYFDVITSKTHWFITYGLFYPRDYQRPCLPILCHENDFEGIRLTVRRQGTGSFGLPERLETFAHGILYPSAVPLTEWRGENRLVVSITGGGHSIYRYRPHPASRGEIEYSLTGQNRYELLPMTWFWERRESVGPDGIWSRRFDYRGRRFSADGLPDTFGSSKFNARYLVQPLWSVKPVGSALAAGDWFFDPAMSTCTLYGCDASFSLDYEDHPYLSELRS